MLRFVNATLQANVGKCSFHSNSFILNEVVPRANLASSLRHGAAILGSECVDGCILVSIGGI